MGLGDSGSERFQHMDATLATALMTYLPRALALRVDQKEQGALKETTFMAGRQALCVIWDWLRTDARVATTYCYSDLTDMPWMDDRATDVQKLLHCWGEILEIRGAQSPLR